MNLLGRTKLMKRVDDTLGVVHTHMVAGALGGFLTGIFATEAGCAAFALKTPGGAIDGNGRQVWVQIVGALFIIGLNVVMTSLICLFIKYVLRIPLRMTEEHMEIGDDAVHGELAYAIFYEGQHSHIEGDFGRSPTREKESSSNFPHTGTTLVGKPVHEAGSGNGSSGDEEMGRGRDVKTD